MGEARQLSERLWAKEGVRVTMGCRVRELSRVGLEIFPCVLFLMSVLDRVGCSGYGESSVRRGLCAGA